MLKQINKETKQKEVKNNYVNKAINYKEEGLVPVPIKISEDNEIKDITDTDKMTEDKIKKWFKKWPKAELAVKTGKESNLMVIETTTINKEEQELNINPKACLFRHEGKENILYCFYKYEDSINIEDNYIEDLDITLYSDGDRVLMPPSKDLTEAPFRKILKRNIENIPEHLIKRIKQYTISEKEKLKEELLSIGNFSPTKIGRLILDLEGEKENYWEYVSNKGKFYHYIDEEGYWRITKKIYLMKIIKHYLMEIKPKWDRKSKVQDVLDSIKNILVSKKKIYKFDTGINPDKKHINLINGMLNVDNYKLKKHSPKYYSQFQLPIKYKPEATCEKWKETLKEWIPDEETRNFIKEYIGYSLIPDNSQQLALILYGTGSNGKGVFLKVLEKLFGDSNVSHTSLSSLSNNRFSIKNIQDKLLNICGDIDPVHLKYTGNIKKIIHGDKLQAEFKHGAHFEFIPISRLIFSANEIPKVRDKSEGWYRSFAIIDFPNTFKPGDKNYDKDLVNKLLKELPGILNWALEGLETYRSRGKFNVPGKIEEAVQDYKHHNDNILSFLDEKTILFDEGLIPRDKLYSVYKKYCNRNGYNPSGKKTFGKRLIDLGYKSESKYHEGKTRGCYTGIKLK